MICFREVLLENTTRHCLVQQDQGKITKACRRVASYVGKHFNSPVEFCALPKTGTVYHVEDLSCFIKCCGIAYELPFFSATENALSFNFSSLRATLSFFRKYLKERRVFRGPSSLRLSWQYFGMTNGWAIQQYGAQSYCFLEKEAVGSKDIDD